MPAKINRIYAETSESKAEKQIPDATQNTPNTIKANHRPRGLRDQAGIEYNKEHFEAKCPMSEGAQP